MYTEYSNILATWCEELTHWKRPWCWERLKEGGEGEDRGWDGWMASLTQWTWVWVNSGNWWWTGRPGMLQSMGSQRVGHHWETELNWTNWTRNIDGQTGMILLVVTDPWWKTRVVCDIMKNISGLRLQLLAQSFKNLCNYLSNRNLSVMLMR